MRGRLGIALFLAGLSLIVVASPAAAKTFFSTVGGKSFVQGETVHAEILGCAGNDVCGRIVKGLKVFLAPGPPTPRGRESATGLRLGGRISRQGRLVFRAPAPPGRWHLIARPYRGAPRLLPVSGAFAVTTPAPPPPSPPPPDPYG